MANVSAVVIMFDPDQTQFLVGRESGWVRDIVNLEKGERDFIRATFSRNTGNNGPIDLDDEIAYYRGQVPVFTANPAIMAKITPHAMTARITFGDIDKAGSSTFTRPRYLPRGRPLKFPGGGVKDIDGGSIQATAVREFKEESGINLEEVPFNVGKLTDTGRISEGYRIFHYICDLTEFAAAQVAIAAKNNDQYAELHDLQFVDVGSQIKNSARTQYRTTVVGVTPLLRLRPSASISGGKRQNKSRRSKQRWARTRRSQRSA